MCYGLGQTNRLTFFLSVSLSVCVADVLEDTAIGSVGEELGHLGPLMEENEGAREGEKLGPQQPQVVRHKKRSQDNTPGINYMQPHYDNCDIFL